MFYLVYKNFKPWEKSLILFYFLNFIYLFIFGCTAQHVGS